MKATEVLRELFSQCAVLARTLVAQVEDSTGLICGADSPLWLWSFRHAGWILTRFGRRRDTGVTPYAKLFCKQYRQPLLMFAEAVIARRPGAQINKLEHHWLEGLWVGRDGSTDEHLVASGGGIVRCRVVKRMTEDRRWLAARFWILPMETLGSFCSTEGTTTIGTWRCRADSYGCVGT